MKPMSTRDALRAALLFAGLAIAGACGGPAPPPPDDRPALSDEKIRESIFQAWVDEIPEETGAAEPIRWHFRRNEPTEVAIVERQADGDRATVVVDVTARSAPQAKSPKVLKGRIRLHYELQTELFLRRWTVVDVDNISMKYRNEPRPDGPSQAAPE